MFSRAIYAIKQAFVQIGRNKGMSFTATLAITAMMLILGLFFVAFVNVDLFANVIKQDYNVVAVYVKPGADPETVKQIGKELENMNGVDHITYTSKEKALTSMKRRWGDNGYLLDNLDTNPLPNSYSVFVNDKDAADEISKTAPQIRGVDGVTYYQNTVEKLARITNFISRASIVVMAFLIVISIIIVANTIKLTVLNRAKEIGIMKYLGATDWFVRAPFVLEGIFIGSISALISAGLMYFIYGRLIDILAPDIMRVLSVPTVPNEYLIKNLLIIFVALGVGIGTCGSIISIRRFLDK